MHEMRFNDVRSIVSASVLAVFLALLVTEGVRSDATLPPGLVAIKTVFEDRSSNSLPFVLEDMDSAGGGSQAGGGPAIRLTGESGYVVGARLNPRCLSGARMSGGTSTGENGQGGWLWVVREECSRSLHWSEKEAAMHSVERAPVELRGGSVSFDLPLPPPLKRIRWLHRLPPSAFGFQMWPSSYYLS
jgi:hypothetical protein